MNENKKREIERIVFEGVSGFATTFKERHLGEKDNPDGVINMKIHNVFISILGSEISFYSALVRSLDSSMGNMLENIAIKIASLSYVVDTEVSGPLYPAQTHKIAELLEEYKRNAKKPVSSDYFSLKSLRSEDYIVKTHVSDYCLTDRNTEVRYLIELKIGGDLDNKKARSEKEALLEQYSILNNTLGPEADVKIYFATAYNRFGEEAEWKQGRVLQFFSKDELLVGRDFWNFVAQDADGYKVVLDAYKSHAPIILDALQEIKRSYLS